VFRLSKWYLDCVTDTGDASIAYIGEAVWGKLRLHYSSLLESTGTQVKERHSFRKPSQPHITGGLLHWESDVLDAEGEWKLDSQKSTGTGIQRTIYRSEIGCIEWHCLAPRAAARIGMRRGLGYAEYLTMTIPPWKLPIASLRWGRFASDSHGIVWIDWQGESSQRFVFADGEAIGSHAVEDGRIEIANGARLTMDRSLVLRDGALGTTVLSRIPTIRKSFPARLLQIRECKWRSRGRLEWPGRPPEEGWVIHERVDWPT